MRIKINIMREQYENLISGSSIQKGEVVEEIVKEALFQLGTEEIGYSDTLKDQVHKGDLILIKGEKRIIAEVKKSHTYETDKLALDYKYKKKGTRAREVYKQSTTNSDKGWLFFTQADWLIAFNSQSCKLYIIREYQKLKKQILEHTENYVKTLKRGERTWFIRGHNNFIHKYLEGFINFNDNCKDSLVVSLELNEKSLNYFECNAIIIDIDLQVEGKNMIQYRLDKAREKRRSRENEKTSNTTDNSKRRSRSHK